MKKKWDEVLYEAQPLVALLSREELFDKPYEATIGAFVIRDATLGLEYATNDSQDQFTDWETVSSDSEGIFPAEFEWNGTIDRRISKDYFGLENKHFNGADVAWTTPTSCVLKELMFRDIRILLTCYSNGIFPPIWQNILTVYLNGGFPCGWTSHLPDGKLVVFSNH